MITLAEFAYLANRSSDAFLRVMAGGSLQQAIHNKRAWEVALASYAKLHSGNGQADEVQLRALAHSAELFKLLWKVYRKNVCRLHQVASFNLHGEIEKVDRCATHREILYCHKEFEDRLKRESY